MSPLPVTIEDVRAARERLADRVHRTPLSSATLLGRSADARLLLKCENLQKTGSFKVRGVLNRIRELDPRAGERGVVTVSAGNHAQALAWASRAAGVPCTVVMPEAAPRTKVEASEGYGARVILHGTAGDAFKKALELAGGDGPTFIHPFDDEAIVAGHGSCGLEIVEDAPDDGPAPEIVLVPVGGGGLLSGIAVAVKALLPRARLFGVEPEGAAAMRRSLDTGEPVHLDGTDTIADGLAAPMAGELNFALIRELVEDVVLVSDEEIADGVRALLRWTKLLAEPAGAAGVAALLAGKIDHEPGATVVAVVSGGNIDLDALATLLRAEEPPTSPTG